MCTRAVYPFSSLCSLALGLVTGGQLGCSLQNGFAVLGGEVVSSLSTERFVAHQQHFKLLDTVDQELPEATGSMCFVSLLFP